MSLIVRKISSIKIKNPLTDLPSLALLNFFILAFFSFFHTSLPFRERSFESLEAETTNFMNQLVYGYLIVSALLILIQNSHGTFNFIKKEKFLTFFILFCIISAVWSNYPVLSVKRSGQLFGTFLTIINAVLLAKSDRLFPVLKFIFVLYIVITYFSGLFIPAAIDTAFNTWRGIELQKNGLGQAGVLIFTVALFFYSSDNSRKNTLNYLISFLAAGLIILSGSSTSIITLLLALAILVTFYFDRVFRPIGRKRTISLLVVVFLTVSTIVIYPFLTELAAVIPELFGKDLSLTGRTLMWPYLMTEVQKQLWFGHGYATYWILGTSVVPRFQENVGWMVNEAHNEYIEILLQLGVTGLFMFLAMLVAIIRRTLKIENNMALTCLISLLVLNITESLLFEARGPTNFIFMFVYVLISYNYFRTQAIEEQ